MREVCIFVVIFFLFQKHNYSKNELLGPNFVYFLLAFTNFTVVSYCCCYCLFAKITLVFFLTERHQISKNYAESDGIKTIFTFITGILINVRKLSITNLEKKNIGVTCICKRPYKWGVTINDLTNICVPRLILKT